jgi:uncharacterized membrane protein YgaE (UPF0421/DUF939 family)
MVKKHWPILKQAVLTGIAGYVSLTIAQAFHLPQGYWAVISAIIVIQFDIDTVIKMSWDRVAGTAIGAILGGMFLILVGEHAWSFALGLGIVVFVTMVIGLMESYRIAAVTMAIVMLTSQSGQPWMVAWHRFIEVSIGIVVALCITTVIYPVQAYRILVGKGKKYTKTNTHE